MITGGFRWLLFKRRTLPRARRLRDDMTREQVRSLLGEPARTWRDDESENSYETWEYDCGVFEERRVVLSVSFYASGQSRSSWSSSSME